jgi:restriction system protein
MSDVALPTYGDFLYPTLKAVADRQGSARKDEVNASVIEAMALTSEQVDVLYPVGSKAKGSKILHRIAFARSSLKLAYALENSDRGVWTITPRGRELMAAGDQAVRQADTEMRRRLKQARDNRAAQSDTVELDIDDDMDLQGAEDEGAQEAHWKRELLAIVESLPPAAFERLCARLLREAGCSEVRVLGRSGDEGLDGVGILQVSLLSFPVYFQAKRYRSDQSIGPDKVRELRGALAGRGDKGLLITTGFFTAAARDEAQRAGAPIDLVDGDQLCDLLLSYRLGVEDRPTVVSTFFDSV